MAKAPIHIKVYTYVYTRETFLQGPRTCLRLVGPPVTPTTNRRAPSGVTSAVQLTGGDFTSERVHGDHEVVWVGVVGPTRCRGLRLYFESPVQACSVACQSVYFPLNIRKENFSMSVCL